VPSGREKRATGHSGSTTGHATPASQSSWSSWSAALSSNLYDSETLRPYPLRAMEGNHDPLCYPGAAKDSQARLPVLQPSHLETPGYCSLRAVSGVFGNQIKPSILNMKHSTRLDSFTIKHLADWCERHRPTCEPAGKVCAQMVSFMNGLEEPDRQFYLDAGWTKTFDAMKQNLCKTQ